VCLTRFTWFAIGRPDQRVFETAVVLPDLVLVGMPAGLGTGTKSPPRTVGKLFELRRPYADVKGPRIT
jgi:hypothetical protein